MRQPLLLLAVLAGLAVGGGWGWWAATRPPVPPPPEVPAELTDPPLVDLLRTRRAAVAASPRTAAAWGDLGLAFQANGRTPEADACYRTAADLLPADGRWPYLRATLVRVGDPAAAADLVRSALASTLPDPAHTVAAKLALADLLAGTGRPAEAEALCREVQAVRPADPRAKHRLAALAVDRGDDAAAIPPLMGMARNPHAQKHAAALLAGIHRRAGRAREADGFEYAASLLPPDRPWPDPFLDPLGPLVRGRQALMEAVARAERENRAGDAAEAARRLVAGYRDPTTLLVLGRSLVTAGRDEEALGVLGEALRGDPGLVMAHAFTGIAQFQLGQRAEGLGKPAAELHYRRAADALTRAVDLKPDYAVGFLYRGRALAALGRTDEAAASVQGFVDRRPEEWEGHHTLAELLLAAGRRDEAVAAAERAVALAKPQEPRPRRLLDQLKPGR